MKNEFEVMDINSLACVCGYFTSYTDANNGYGCNHPEQEQYEELYDDNGYTRRGFEDDASKPKTRQGKCLASSCPIAFYCTTMEDLKEYAPETAEESMLVTLLGIMTLVRPAQPLNASRSILVTPSGIMATPSLISKFAIIYNYYCPYIVRYYQVNYSVLIFSISISTSTSISSSKSPYSSVFQILISSPQVARHITGASIPYT